MWKETDISVDVTDIFFFKNNAGLISIVCPTVASLLGNSTFHYDTV